MSEKLEKLLHKKAKLEAFQQRTKIAIAKERKNMRDTNRQENSSTVTINKTYYQQILRQNQVLRRLIPLIKKASGCTYKQVAAFVGVSESRAKQLVREQILSIRKL